MARALTSTVYVIDADGDAGDVGATVALNPGDTVPGWAQSQVVNPKAFGLDPKAWKDRDLYAAADDDDDDAEDAGDGEPKRPTKRSGVDTWREYATAIGVDVDDDADRDEIIAAVDAAG